jgi:Zn-dependent peptidase ImmA (M78 family)/DNA-binding XRE family transcriptional regulator
MLRPDMPSARSPSVKVNPLVLTWARESAGLSLDDVARRLNTSGDTVAAWETGRKSPTFHALEVLASFLKRPLAALFLPDPPQDKPLPHDFRLLPGAERVPLSSKSRLVLRRAQRLQKLARELLTEMGLEVAPATATAKLTSNPEEVANAERGRLGISVEQQRQWKNSHEALRGWRRAIEDESVLVFQFSMPVKECRGFSLTELDPPVVVLNAADSVNARIFTLAHEYAHILLRKGGLCLFEEGQIGRDDPPVERFCNRFAGALLVPLDAILLDLRGLPVADYGALADGDLAALAEHFHVSKYVIWRRMSTAQLVSPDAYWSRLSSWPQEAPAVLKKRKGGPSAARKCIQQRGRRFASIVFEAKHRDVITYRDVTDYLAVGPRHLGRLESLLR